MNSAEAMRRRLELLSLECPEPDLGPALEAAKLLLSKEHANQLLHGLIQTQSSASNWQDLLRSGVSNAEEAAVAINTLAQQLLGFQPDVERERVSISPIVPDDWTFLRTRDIKTDDSAIALEYDRSPLRILWSITQETGASPLRLIFAPTLPKLPRQITIDGKPAELDAKGTMMQMQIVLDATRVVVFEF